MNSGSNGGDSHADINIFGASGTAPASAVASGTTTTDNNNNNNNNNNNRPTITQDDCGNDSCVKGEESAVDVLSRKRPKRKVAIIFGYVGERYYGLQWNHMPDYPTIEEELLRALHRTNMISQENYEQDKVQQKLSWERSSRTDKGVHALRNVISLNIMLPYKKGSTTQFDTEEARRQLAAVLPHDIIVYEIVPVTRSFNAYMMCGARTYEYYLPTFAFMTKEEYSKVYFPPEIAPLRPTLEEVGFISSSSKRDKTAGRMTSLSVPVPGEKRQRKNEEEYVGESGEVTDGAKSDPVLNENAASERHDEQGKAVDGENDTVHKFHDRLFEKLMVFRTIPEETMMRLARYRLSSEQLEQVRSIFRLYEGTHSYHNFTPGGRADDPSSVRYITSVTVGEPFVVDPASPNILLTLENWTPSRCYSPDDERTTLLAHTDEENVDQQRLRMQEHMLQLYGKGEGGGSGGNEEGRERGLEVVRIELHGQSFMLNQIRKMIGVVVSMCAAGLPPDYLRNHMFNKAVRCGTPMAPANGLFLSYLDFQRYNYRLGRIQCEGDNGSGKNGVYVDRVSEAAVSDFRNKIVSVVLRNEMVGDVMGRWMRSLRHVLRLACDVELP